MILTCQLMHNWILVRFATMWLLVRFVNKTFIVAHGWIKQVEDFPFDIYNRVKRRQAMQRGVTTRQLLSLGEATILVV